MGTSGANFSGRRFSSSELSLIQELVESCGGLSRMELARTVCELLDWKRPTGKLKARECREFLERLEGEGRLELPDKRPGKPVGTRTRIPQTERGEPSEPLEGELSEIQPVVLEVVRSDEQRLLFRELGGPASLLGPRGSLWRSSALSGVRIGAGTGGGLCAVVESGVEDGGTRFVDWMGRCHARAEPAASG